MQTTQNESIYFDNAATTMVSKGAAEVAYDTMTSLYANPSSAHSFGFEAEKLLKKCREDILDVLGYTNRQGTVVFTSCGTEADNMAIFGAVKTLKRKGRHIVISDSEHPAVENCAKELENSGYTVDRIPTKGGVLDLDVCKKVLTPDTVLVSCMSINNETGAVYDIGALRKLAAKQCPDAYVHTDAVQAFTKLPKLSCFDCDLISVSGHKIHAPKGIGALFIKKGVRIPPLLLGGGQEGGLRSGTEALPGIAAFAFAARQAKQNFETNSAHVAQLHAYLHEKVAQNPLIVSNLCTGKQDSHIYSLAVPGIRSEILLRFLAERNIFVSAGSACSAKHADNRVLTAFGLSDALADSTLRISFSAYNTTEEIDKFVQVLNEGMNSLIKVKP